MKFQISLDVSISCHQAMVGKAFKPAHSAVQNINFDPEMFQHTKMSSALKEDTLACLLYP